MTQTASLEARRADNLRRLFSPHSIAIVGASSDPSKAGSQALKSLKGFPGRLIPINPKESEIGGLRCYPNLASVPESVDLAILAIPAVHCVTAAAEAAQSGVGGVFIISGGFGEAGDAGAELQGRLADICAQSGMRLLGPNTSGFINPYAQCVASFVPGVDQLRSGRIAVVAQSGGVNLSVAFLVERLGEGISLAAGLGNAVDVKSADVLEMLAADPHTGVIALHLEGVPDGKRLFEVISRVTRIKPVVALIAGRADIGEFAVSHTGNLMGSYQRTASALIQAGAVVVDSTEELAQAASVLSYRRLAPSADAGFAIVTGQAGPALLIVDGLKTAGCRVPELSEQSMERIQALLPPMTFVKNPVDTGRPGASFPKVVQHVAEDPSVDAVLVYGLSEPSVLNPVASLRPALESTGKPVVFGTLGMAADMSPELAALRDASIPVVQSPERLVLAGRVLAADARGQYRLGKARVPSSGTLASSRLEGTFDEDRSKELLSSIGITSPARRLCIGKAQALQAFEQLSKPVVVKISADDIPHKSEVGGVFLNVRTAAEFDKALSSIALIPTKTPGRVLVEEMAQEGVELIVGAVRDASWGACVVIGLGGVLAEALADSSVRLAPLTEHDVSDMLEGLRGKAVLNGFRHLPVCDRSAITQVAIQLGALLDQHPEISEVEINPLRVHAKGAQALDALVVITESTT